jgi:hypothetical protein
MSTSNNWASLLPGRNPAGTNLASDYSLLPATGSTSGQNPLMASPNLPVGAPANNPYSSSPVPSFGANTGAYSPTNLLGTSGTAGAPGLANEQQGAMGSLLSGMTQGGLNDMYHELNKTYGEGTASAIMSFLLSGAGFNQQAINNLFAALQPGIERGTESLMGQFSATGNRFGSGAQIGLADYLSQVQLNEGQIETQLYESSVQDWLSTLLDVAGGNKQRISSSPSTLDSILSGLNLGGTAAGGVSSLVSAINPGADTSILDTLSSLAGAL